MKNKNSSPAYLSIPKSRRVLARLPDTFTMHDVWDVLKEERVLTNVPEATARMRIHLMKKARMIRVKEYRVKDRVAIYEKAT